MRAAWARTRRLQAIPVHERSSGPHVGVIRFADVVFVPRRRLFRFLCGTFSPSRCQSRNTRASPALHPSRTSSPPILRSPNLGRARANWSIRFTSGASSVLGFALTLAAARLADRFAVFARRCRTSTEARSQPLATGKGLPVSLREMLQHLDIEGLVGHDLLLSSVLVLEGLEPLRLLAGCG